MLTTTPHWTGLGAAVLPGDTTVVAAANGVLAFFDANPCTKASIPAVSAFQSAYNASGLPGALTVDGQYGPNTQKALQNTIDSVETGMGPTQAAPQNCFDPNLPAVPAPDVVPAAQPPAANATTTTTTTTTGHGSAMNPGVVAAAAALVVGGVGYAVYRARKRR